MRATPELPGIGRLGDAPARLLAAIGSVSTIVGWATVDLDRATTDAGRDLREAEPDELLGARCRIVRSGDPGSEAREVVVLEPSTEGLLAAGLARHGEGPIALYHLAGPSAAMQARQAGFHLSSPAGGPLGPQRRVLLGPRDGPFLLLVDST